MVCNELRASLHPFTVTGETCTLQNARIHINTFGWKLLGRVKNIFCRQRCDERAAKQAHDDKKAWEKPTAKLVNIMILIWQIEFLTFGVWLVMCPLEFSPLKTTIKTWYLISADLMQLTSYLVALHTWCPVRTALDLPQIHNYGFSLFIYYVYAKWMTKYCFTGHDSKWDTSWFRNAENEFVVGVVVDSDGSNDICEIEIVQKNQKRTHRRVEWIGGESPLRTYHIISVG